MPSWLSWGTPSEASSTAREQWTRVRDDMVADLLQHDLTEGMPRSAVVQLLGGSDEAGTAAAGPGDEVYKLSCGIDCSWLVVQFDVEDRLSDATVWND